MTTRPAHIIAAQDQLRAGVREVTSGESLRQLRVVARNLDERGCFEKAASLRLVIGVLDMWAIDLVSLFDDEGAV